MSQQPTSLRLPTQADEQINGLPSPVEGLIKRPPTEYIKKLSSGTLGNSYIHTINRDSTERYVVIITNGAITVHDLDGTAKTVNTPDGVAYITTSTPEDDLVALTVADYTFIVNKTVTTAMDAALSTDPGDEALVYVKQGNYQQDYIIKIDGYEAARIKTATNSFGETIKTNDIAQKLKDQLDTALGFDVTTGNWTEGTLTLTETGAFTDLTVINETGLTWTGGSNMEISKGSAWAGSLSEGQYVYVSGTNVKEGWYQIKSVRSDGFSITLFDDISGNHTVAASGVVVQTRPRIYLTGGTDVTPGFYEIASKTDADNIVLFESITPTAGNLSNTDITAASGWSVDRIDSTLHIRKDDTTAFKLDTEDSFNNEALRGIKDTVRDISDLPTKAHNGFIVKVSGDNEQGEDDYYVVFETNSGDNYGDGRWVETIAPGIAYKYDATTMPHQLVREPGGTFTFQEVEWADRVVGDTDTSPDPSFIGREISDVFFHKNRLGFTASDKVIMSRAGEFFSFFRETVTTILDTDPIDVTSASKEVANFKAAVPWNETLILFTDSAQYRLSGGDLLTPNSVSISLTTQFETDLSSYPIGVGKNIFFTTDKGVSTGVREYYIASDTQIHDAADITAHVPTYLGDNPKKLAGSTNQDLLVFLPGDTSDPLYIYKYFWSGDQKLISSWSKWTFGDNSTVLNQDFIDTCLYLVLQRTDGVYLEKMCIEPSRSDLYVEWLCHLDQRVQDDTTGVSSVYNAGPNQTVFTLPHALDGDPMVIQRADGVSPSVTPGVSIPVVSSTSTTVTVSGDHTSTPVFIGTEYSFQYTFSKPTVTTRDGQGRESVEVATGRFQITNLHIKYSDTGFFNVESTPLYRDMYTNSFTGRVLGSGNNLLGSVVLESGIFSVRQHAKNDELTVTIRNDSFLPCKFTGAEWEGNYVNRTRRIG